MIISSDCHIDFPLRRAKEFLEREYHDEFDRWSSMFAAGFGDEVENISASHGDGDGRHAFENPVDIDSRLAVLDANGVAAEIIIPNFWTIPFFPVPGARRQPGYDPALFTAGCRAYNRWLAESVDPDRQAALAQLTFDDVEEAVAEIRRAGQAQMRGVSLDSHVPGLAPLFDERYEPIWTALEDEQMTATFHIAAGYEPDVPSMSPVATKVVGMEVGWFAHRPLWWLIYGGVLERHPGLNLVFTEQFADWVPGTVAHMDRDWASKGGEALRAQLGHEGLLPRSPGEYWARQCSVGASLLSRAELETRHQIGVDNIMYGTDFAHPEGSWGNTLEYLQALFGAGGVPEDETRRILGENAARVYRFDVDKLAPVVARAGFTIDEVLAPPAGALDAEIEASVGRGFKGW